MGLRFEWDAGKAAENLAKHGVTFDEAATVFFNPITAIFDDEDHSIGEAREIAVGHSIVGRLLIVAFTERARDVVRIISARKTTRAEKRDYEQGTKT